MPLDSITAHRQLSKVCIQNFHSRVFQGFIYAKLMAFDICRCTVYAIKVQSMAEREILF